MSLRMGICTQTPLLKFEPSVQDGEVVGEDGHLLSMGTRKHRMTPGGVCRMVLPTLREWHHTGFLGEAHWLSLQPNAPPVVGFDGLPLDIHHLTLPEDGLAAYARTKEKLWADIHGLDAPPWRPEDFRFYARYNWFNVDALLERAEDLDVAYIHDFQLLQAGALLGLAAPSVLRWHVPFRPERIPEYTLRFLTGCMEDFDAVVVSTRRELEGLVRAGLQGHVTQIYPHIDLDQWPDVGPSDVERLERAWDLHPDAPLLLSVARMDPMKRQDLAIQALARLKRRHPDARLVLVGNGSFSGSGGLGLTKSERWRAHLERLADRLGVADRVLFAHYVPDDLLAAAYRRAHAVVLASDIEGFGITTLEAWRYGTPSVLSDGVGSAEVVQKGVTGETFPAGDAEALADRLHGLLSDGELRHHMGEAGRETLPAHAAPAAAAQERDVLEGALERFHAA